MVTDERRANGGDSQRLFGRAWMATIVLEHRVAEVTPVADKSGGAG
jgi:hypothetical protein